jgi:Flp pilus assembly protein TadG
MRSERGSAALELVLTTPVLLILLLLMVFAGRLAEARADINGSAQDAARAASVARGPDAAATDGEAAASARIQTGKVTCRHLGVQIDTSNFRPGGLVVATVTCTVDLGDLGLLGVPATKSISAKFTEPIDTFIGGSP